MRQEFYKIYESLYRDYGRRLDESFTRRRRAWQPIDLKVAVEETINKHLLKVRPDAKHFLLVNFEEMILLPLFQSDTRHGLSRLADPEMSMNIRHDLFVILNTAQDFARERRARTVTAEISGGDVLRGIVESWEELKLTRIDVWG